MRAAYAASQSLHSWKGFARPEPGTNEKIHEWKIHESRRGDPAHPRREPRDTSSAQAACWNCASRPLKRNL